MSYRPKSITAMKALLLVAACAIGTGGGTVAIAAPAPQVAGSPELMFDQGKRLFDAFQYDQAVPVFNQIVALLSAPGQAPKPDLLVQTLELRARARFSTGDAAGAEQDFSALLQVNPAFKLGPGISPRVVAVFESVRKITIGQASMSMTPAGDVQIDGRTVALRAEPQIVDLQIGEHQISATRPGYRALEQRFTVASGASVTLALVLERVSSTLTFSTYPEGVEVSLDGTARGTTGRGDSSTGPSAPFVITDIPTGSHRLQLRRACYQDLERTISIAQPDDLRTEPLRLSPAVANVRVQSTEAGATIFLDGVSQGAAPSDLRNLCAGPHVIEVRGPRGRFIDRREWKAGDSETLAVELRSAFPIIATTGTTGTAAAELRAGVERTLAPARRVLIYGPTQAEVDAAMRGENVPANWLEVSPFGTATTRVPKEIVRDLGRRLATKLASQGVAVVSVGADPYQVSVALLAAGSGEPDVFVVNLADPASRTHAIERLGAPLPPLMRPSLESSVVDLAGVSGAVVVRAGGAGAKAGLAVGDVIVGAGGSPVTSVGDLRAKILALRAPALDLPLEVKNQAGVTRTVNGAVAVVPDTLPIRDPLLSYNKALAELDEAARVATSPVDRSAAHLNLGIVQMRLGNWTEAETELRSVTLPDGPGVSAGTVAYLTGLCLEAMGRTADARTAFAKAAQSPQARVSADGPLVAPLAQQKIGR